MVKPTFTMRFSESDKKQLEAIAEQKDSSLAQVVREALRAYLKANNVA
ncbi:MAG: ribbon-helix-helix protein, CopG family [Trichormus sp.]